MLIVCCDGLSGFPEAIAATWPEATVQTCVVHLIRAAMRFVNYADRKAVAAALKPIYQAANADGALIELEAFEATPLGKRYPSAIKAFRDAWERFTPFLAFPPALRRVIYTTNAIESLNYQLRKVTKNRGHFPNDVRTPSALPGHSTDSRSGIGSPRAATRADVHHHWMCHVSHPIDTGGTGSGASSQSGRQAPSRPWRIVWVDEAETHRHRSPVSGGSQTSRANDQVTRNCQLTV